MELNELDKSIDKLVKDYQKAYQWILKRLEYQIENGLSETQSMTMLKEIQDKLNQLDEKAYKWCQDVLPEYYYTSLSAIDEQVSLLVGAGASNVAVISGTGLIMLHTKAVEAASRDLYKDLAKNTTFMSEQAKKIIRDNTSELLTRMTMTGESQKRIKKELRENLLRDGIGSFVDAGGKTWKIYDYANMAVRTKSRILHHEGTFNRLSEYGDKYPKPKGNFDLIQISKHNSICWCGKYEGTVWSISGDHPDYPSIELLPNRPYKTLHPNCKHVFLPFIEALRGKGQVISNDLLSRDIKSLMKDHYHSSKGE
jgi:DNA-binding ferritin-like protein (Dps family)